MRLIANLTILGLLCAAPQAAEKVVIYGDDDYPPYSFVADKRFQGIYVELIQRAAARLAPQYQIELQPVPWKRGLAELEQGKSLAMFPPYLRRERAFIQSYSRPLYRESVQLFCSEAAMKTPRSRFPDDFKGLSVGINDGFMLTDTLQAAVKSGAIRLEGVKGNDSNLLKLAAGRTDCYANDALAVRYALRRLQRASDVPVPLRNFKLLPAAELGGENAYIAYGQAFKAPYKDDFIRRLDAALAEIPREELDKLIARYTE